MSDLQICSEEEEKINSKTRVFKQTNKQLKKPVLLFIVLDASAQ
jgi:hypothetical protein